ncbi:MAG: hypothetical protein Ct9H300mP13_0430 [Gammaproteobacteria bacterium]|nr:MAG: hypothetical protein Ct9H300mP13_0430 [Gammaproteobacteria bacterium]
MSVPTGRASPFFCAYCLAPRNPARDGSTAHRALCHRLRSAATVHRTHHADKRGPFSCVVGQLKCCDEPDHADASGFFPIVQKSRWLALRWGVPACAAGVRTVGKPQLLILDEPTQGLDQPAVAAFYGLIEEVRNEMGCAILWSAMTCMWLCVDPTE